MKETKIENAIIDALNDERTRKKLKLPFKKHEIFISKGYDVALVNTHTSQLVNPTKYLKNKSFIDALQQKKEES